MLPLILSPEAEKEIYDAFAWYEAQQIGLGNEFILCLDATMHSIARRCSKRVSSCQLPVIGDQ